MKINLKDVGWNYGATLLKIGSSLFLLPLILNKLPTEKVAIWSLFGVINSFSLLVDFGFNFTFARNITYIFNGANRLLKNGVEINYSPVVNYDLLAGCLNAMKWLYLRLAIIVLALMVILGTTYIYSILKNYTLNKEEVYIAWSILCLYTSYNLFTLYYESLLIGKGLIKRSKQITIVGHGTYLFLASILILANFDLIAITVSQFSSVIIVRYLSRKTFLTKDLKEKLASTTPVPRKEVLSGISPNAIKTGVTSLSGFLVQRSSLLIGAMYLSLAEIASYSVTMQIISVISGLSIIYFNTFQPQIAHYRVNNDVPKIRAIVINSFRVFILTYIILGTLFLILGEWGIALINSKTLLLNKWLILLCLLLSFEQTNIILSGGILITKNEVPFFKAALLSGISIVVLLFVVFNSIVQHISVMIFVPLLVDLSYQSWKWTSEVLVESNILRRITRS